MPSVSLKELVEAGVHFGHRTSRWNPKMKPYIYGRRNLIHIINLKETAKGLVRARHFLYNLSAEGGEVLFVATKRQARDVVKQMALSCGMPHVTERWLGGMLTNYATIRSRLKTLEELERLVATGEIAQHSKKMIATINRNIRKLRRNLDGVRHMTRLPAAVVIVDPRREEIALSEANKLSIASICILDTDCDPDGVDICIPANDDAMRSVRVLCGELAGAVAAGKKEFEQRAALEKKQAEEKAAREREKERKRREAEAKKRADEAAVKAALHARDEAQAKKEPQAADATAPAKPEAAATPAGRTARTKTAGEPTAAPKRTRPPAAGTRKPTKTTPAKAEPARSAEDAEPARRGGAAEPGQTGVA